MQAPDIPDLYRQLLDNSSDPIFSFAPDFRYLYANQAFADGIGKNLEEIVGRTLWDVFPKNEADKRAALTRWVFEHGEAKSHEILVRGRDGDRYYLTTVTPIFGAQGGVKSVVANSKDITKRKKFEEQLQHSQTMLERTESFAHIGSWEWDVATDTVTWSDELFRIFLRNPADGAPSFAEHSELYHSKDMPRLKGAVKATLSHGKPYELELRAIRQDGETRVCLARGYAEMSPDQRVTHLFGSLQDITDRKQIEAALSESETFLRVIIDSVPDQVAVIDRDGVIVQVNEPWRRFSLENSSVPGKPALLTDVGTNYIAVCRASTGSRAEGSKAADEGIQAVLEGRLTSFSMDYPCHSPDQQRWFTMRVSPLEGNRRGAVIAHTDITDQMLANDALRQSENLLKSMTTALPGVVYQFSRAPDGEWKFLYLSKGIEELYEVTAEEAYRDHRVMSDLIVPEDRTSHLEAVEHSAASLSSWAHEHRIRTSSGKLKWVRGAAMPERQEDGSVVWNGILTDITERKQAEAELIQYRDHLEELVSARTAELEQSRDAAEAGNRAKTIFLANMSHELHTPMNGVMGMIDLVLMRATDPKQIDWLTKSKRAAQRMVKVVDDILDFSKIEAERLPLEEKNFSLTKMIDDAIAMQDIIAEEKGLNLTREIPPTFPVQLSGDAFRVRQILLNFLGNACKFSDHGTIIVRVSAIEQVGDSVLARIEVEDQGIGISPEQQAILFRSFAQADGSMTRKYGGSGLGLIISKRLANLMGGDAGMESREGRGSTFWATVRLQQARTCEVRI